MATTTTTTWTIDSAHSAASFQVRHMMFSKVNGSIGTVSGTIKWDENDIANSSVNVEIDNAALSTNDAKRDAHLRSADFFDVESNPTITFKSTSVSGTPDEFQVVGDLTMHGVTNQVTLDAEYNGRGASPFGFDVISFSATTKINRADYGLTWNAALESGGVMVSDEVKITLEIEANPATEEKE